MSNTDTKTEIKSGQRWVHELTGRTMRVMTVSEKWVMYRFKGGHPLVGFETDIIGKFKLKP